MRQRRLYKKKTNRYREMQREIRSEVHSAKEKHTEAEFHELEELSRKHNLLNMHRKKKHGNTWKQQSWIITFECTGYSTHKHRGETYGMHKLYRITF